MVPKPGGGWRPCGDYRRLNQITTPDWYPLPNMQDLANHLHGATVFSKLDLVKGDHQVPVAEADKAKTAIITPFGLFEYNFMPFGLRNAGQTFQRLIDQNFRDLPFCFPLANNNLVGSTDRRLYLEHLRQVFQIMDKCGLALNIAQCKFGQPTGPFLGHCLPPQAQNHQ